MSVDQIERQIENLSKDDLSRFTAWFDQYLGRTAEADAGDELQPQERAELIRRRDELLANSELAEPMDDNYFDALHRELADARARKASQH